MSSLELRDVIKYYTSGAETVRAVDGVSLDVDPGEFVAIYGPSGSGKTTLLLLAAGLSRPDSGVIAFGGSDISLMSTAQRDRFRRKDVGFIFQSFHLMPGASALNNAALKLLASRYTVRSAKREAFPWLERVGLADRADHIPEQLSMGEQQRVAIARALVNKPRLLLADEPTGSLDSKRSNEILGLLRDVCHEYMIPGLIVTHDQQALAFVDRVHSLRDGRLIDGVDAELAAAWTINS